MLRLDFNAARKLKLYTLALTYRANFTMLSESGFEIVIYRVEHVGLEGFAWVVLHFLLDFA